MRTGLGFMQGRLVDRVDGKIQAFPFRDWQNEFPIAQTLGIKYIEWTVDASTLLNNPLCTEKGRADIKKYSMKYGLSVASITGDCFMQAPFWKCDASDRSRLLKDFDLILVSASKVGSSHIVIPLVDQGRLDNQEQEEILISQCLDRIDMLRSYKIRLVFECDRGPQEFARLIERFPKDCFGINYDIGNSASLGYDPTEELSAYGERVYHIHVKDRVFGGATVPLGTGNAQFDLVFNKLSMLGYCGLFVLQTARAEDNNHIQVLKRYIHFTEQYMEKYFGS